MAFSFFDYAVNNNSCARTLKLVLVLIQVFLIPVIVITFYSPGCLGQETAKELFGLPVKLLPVHHTQPRLHTVPVIAERQAGKL